jgi:hypothetical protein
MFLHVLVNPTPIAGGPCESAQLHFRGKEMIDLPEGAVLVGEAHITILDLTSSDNNAIVKKLKASEPPAGYRRTVTGGFNGHGLRVEVRDDKE